MKLRVDYHNEPLLKELQRRIWIFYLFLGILFFVMLSRLIYLQIIQGSELYSFAEKNLLKEIRVQAPRGLITDRHNQVIVENLPNFTLTLSPQFVEDKDSLTLDLSRVLNITQEEIKQRITKQLRKQGPYRPVVLKEYLTRSQILAVELLKIEHPGIQVEEQIYRYYKYGSIYAHVIGYTAEVSRHELPKVRKLKSSDIRQGDIVGKRGLEENYDSVLLGKSGKSFVKVDAKGQQKLSESLRFLGQVDDIPPVPGHSIQTTFDTHLQQTAYKLFEEHQQNGTLVALNNKGEILTLVSYPAFDPNNFSRGISFKDWSKLINSPRKPLRNKGIQDHHPPGSTFKPIVALAALQQKKITSNTLVHAPSKFTYGKRTYHDHTRTGQGYITVEQAIESSSNVFFYKQGLELGVDKISLYAKSLGLGKRTQSDLNGEAKGLIPTRAWKKKHIGETWQPGENISTAIGQGFVLVNPLQLAAAYMAIGNNGKYYKPYMVKRVLTSDKKTLLQYESKLTHDLADKDSDAHISQEVFDTVKKGLYRVANGSRGTARYAKIPNFKIAGKTGTAQVRGFSANEIYGVCANRPWKQKHHGWYVAFGPYKKPEITVLVLTEHSCSSSKSVPIVRDFFTEYVKKYHPQLVAEQ